MNFIILMDKIEAGADLVRTITSKYTLIFLILGFKHDVLITGKPLRGVFNKVLSILSLSYNGPGVTELVFE